jgi:hypothetical protein
MPSHASLAKHRQRRPHRGPRQERGRPAPRLYSVGQLLTAYTAAVLANLGCLLLVPPMAVLAYPVAGVCLSRYVGRRIIWWNQADSIKNVASAKIHMVLTWPISAPVFIWQVLVANHL